MRTEDHRCVAKRRCLPILPAARRSASRAAIFTDERGAIIKPVLGRRDYPPLTTIAVHVVRDTIDMFN
jgi:hypothetical protein